MNTTAFTRLFAAFILAFVLALGSPTALASEDALLELLVKKKLITAEDAAAVRAEMKKESPAKPQSHSSSAAADNSKAAEIPMAKTSADKWKLSTPITELELYGDARVRYEIRNGENLTDDTIQRNRERYRLRLGLRGTLADDWFFGVRLETNQNSRSTNVTFGDDTSSSSGGGGGPFAKGSDGINVGQAYFGYKGFKDITLTVGKMQNPLVSTFMVWDSDIDPEGLAEQWKHTFTLSMGGSESDEPTSYTKDGVALPAPKTKSKDLKIDVFANFAQFVYDDSNPENPAGPSPKGIPNTDAYMLAWQIGTKFTFPNGLYAQVAPTLYNYSGTGDTFYVHFQGGDPNLSNNASLAQNQTGINSLLVFDVPAEIGWKLGDLPMRLFADFAVNLDGDDRAAAAGHAGKGDQRYAYQVGAAVGQLKHKGDWQLSVFWQRQDQYSLDPNLVDTEFWDSKLNIEGVGATLGYMLSDAVWVSLLYGYAEHADHALGTAGAGDIAFNPLKNFQLFQVDLNVKF
jgi:hypothetical protein